MGGAAGVALGNLMLPAKMNESWGTDSPRRRTDALTKGRVRSAPDYRGIDLAYDGRGPQLEQDVAIASWTGCGRVPQIMTVTKPPQRREPELRTANH